MESCLTAQPQFHAGRVLYVFSIGVGKKKEPLVAVIASWILVQVSIAIATV